MNGPVVSCSVIVHIDELVAHGRSASAGVPVRSVLAGQCASAGAAGIVLEIGDEGPALSAAGVRELRAVAGGCRIELRVVATEAMARLAGDLDVDHVTLCPASSGASSKAGGSSLVTELAQVAAVIAGAGATLPGLGLMIAADRGEVEMAHLLGVRRVRLDVAALAGAVGAPAGGPREIDPLRRAAVRAHELGLRVAVGGGLSPQEISAVGGIGSIDEVEVGGQLLTPGSIAELPRAITQVRETVAGARKAFEAAISAQSKARP